MAKLEQELAKDSPLYDRRTFLTTAAVSLAGLAAELALPKRADAKQRSRPPQASRPAQSQATENLDQKLRDHIKGKLKDGENIALSVYDLVSGKKLASINDKEGVQAASMIKPLVALAYFHKVNEGRMRYTPQIKHAMEMMLQKSDNVATNWLMQLLGGPSKVQSILKTGYGAMLQQIDINDYIPLIKGDILKAKSRGLETKDVPSGNSYYSNLASAQDYQEFLQALWAKKFPYSGELLRMMALPKKNRTVWGVDGIPEGTKVHSRTGTSGRVAGDMAIVQSKGNDGKIYPYVFVAIIERKESDGLFWTWKKGYAIRGISSKVYQHMKGLYNLQ